MLFDVCNVRLILRDLGKFFRVQVHIERGAGQVLDEISSITCRRAAQPCASGVKLGDGMVGGGGNFAEVALGAV